MEQQSTAELLQELITFIEAHNWTKGFEARDINDKPVKFYHDQANSWCLRGAISKTFIDEPENQTHVVLAIAEWIGERYGFGIITFNDYPTRTKMEVIQVLKRIKAKWERE